MIAVVSHAWLRSGEHHAAEFIRIAAEFTAFHRAAPGFRGRRLARGIDDPTHIINTRYFDSVADYERLVLLPGYGVWIDRLSEHVEPRSPAKEYLEVVLEDPDVP